MRKGFLGFSVIAIIVLYCSCAKRSFEPEINLPQADTLNISASVIGRVIDEIGQPVAGANVTVGISQFVTNNNGEFTFNKVMMNDYAAVVTATKSGYYSGSKTIMAREGMVHYAAIQLYKLNDMATISNVAGGSFQTNDGVSINFPANSLKVAGSGASYLGNIHVSLSYIQPNISGSNIPGSDRGMDANNQEKWLQSFGMVQLNFWGDNGETLNFDTGKSAKLSFPFPEILRPLVQQTIKLWKFDASSGFWLETGTASISSSTNYSININTTGAYNAAIDLIGVRYNVTVRDTKNNALQFAPIRIKRVYSNTYSYARTDSTGYAAALVPSDEPLLLEVFGTAGCQSQILLSKNNGPYAAGRVASAGVESVNTTGTYGNAIISGSLVNCVGQSVAVGAVHFNYGGIAYTAPVLNGSFLFNIPMCKSNDTVTYYAEDLASNTITRFSSAVIFAGTNNTFNNISVCGNSLKSTVTYIFDSLPITDTIYSPNDSIVGLGIGNIASPFTSIYAKSNNSSISFSFDSIYQTGSFAMKTFNILNSKIAGTDTAFAPSQLNVSVTEYGRVGGFISGSFNGIIIGLPSNKVHSVIGAFRVRRNY